MVFLDGEVQEWLNWPLSKSGEPQGSEGSNPSLSAKTNDVHLGVFCFDRDLNPRAARSDAGRGAR